MFRVICLFVLASIALYASPLAQVSIGGTPVSFGQAYKSDIHTVVMPQLDMAAIRAEDEIDKAEGLPFRFGYGTDVENNLENSGTWEDTDDGGRIWRLKFVSPGAYSLNLLYSSFHIPAGARFYLYSDDHAMVIGAFTDLNNKDHNEFSTGPIRGEVTVLEYYEPAEVWGLGKITVSSVVHGYIDIFSYNVAKEAAGFGSSGSCNNNVNCPEGEPWLADNRAVAMILTAGNQRICSGALVNNVREDQTPYFLTAHHCLGGEATWIFMFLYESPSCSNINGPTYNTLSGSTKRANYVVSDFALLELTEFPPESYNVFYAGWSNIDVASQTSTGIHHPSGDIKKISFDYDPATSTNYLSTTGTTHWRIGNWEDGTTEGGSSGSPLFDQNHRIVGQLHGGYASCTSITPDWYGKFSRSWNGGGSSSNQLNYWLDPDNTGASTLDGLDPFAGTNISHNALPNTRDTLNNYEVVCDITSNGTLDPDKLLLHYEHSSFWYQEQLTATGNPDEYHGYIAAQPSGTVIGYYLTAEDFDGVADTTATFVFEVEYSPSISITPGSFAVTLNQGDSVIEDLIIESVGNGPLDYSVSIQPTSKKIDVFGQLLAFEEVAPATRQYDQDFLDYEDIKGIEDSRQGYPVDKSAGGPDNFGYFWLDSDEAGGPAFDWVDISASGTEITSELDDDNYSGPYPMGFHFPFYGDTYNQFYVASNGMIGFDPTNLNSRSKTNLPNSSAPNNILAWLWDDLDPTDGNNSAVHVYYYSDGARCIIQFVDYPEYNAAAGDVVNAEVILEADGTIVYQYLSLAPGFDNDNCAIGIENSDGTDGLEVAFLSPYLHDNLALAFYMPYQWLILDSNAGTVQPGNADTISCTFRAIDLDIGIYNSDIIITSNDPDPGDSPQTVATQLTVEEGIQYICGDANGDEVVNLGDAQFIINYVFFEGPAPYPFASGNPNCDDSVNVADASYLINYIFRDGAPPCCQ